MKFTENDIAQIHAHGLTLEEVEEQVSTIKKGMSYSKLLLAASIGNGINRLDDDELEHYVEVFEENRDELSLVKFVPASGAATRMFKFLFQFLKNYDIEKETIQSFTENNKHTGVNVFFSSLNKLPFYEEVVRKLHEINPKINDLKDDEKRLEFVKTMLDEDRLNYGNYPKGLLPFHKYEDRISTAFEEHLFEAAFYASSKRVANAHFTISQDHNRKFDLELDHIEEDVEEQTRTKFNISFSNQKKSTDTIALTLDNQLYRDEKGELLFRASGHGALLKNLNILDYDVIFIKNIDNVTVVNKSEELSKYKKVLAGVLIETQQDIFDFLNQLDSGEANEKDCKIIAEFLHERFDYKIPEAFKNYYLTEKLDYLKEKLNRPIRVGGMVKNENEPGGGPFWVEDKKGDRTLQIIEFAQIDLNDENQKRIVNEATHFNPTDFACGIKNYKGEVFDLQKFVDNEANFITIKSHFDQEIKALERPGLWNGSMAYWNSIFIEVPLTTFNPVKTVNDLLKSAHQSE